MLGHQWTKDAMSIRSRPLCPLTYLQYLLFADHIEWTVHNKLLSCYCSIYKLCVAVCGGLSDATTACQCWANQTTGISITMSRAHIMMFWIAINKLSEWLFSKVLARPGFCSWPGHVSPGTSRNDFWSSLSVVVTPELFWTCKASARQQAIPLPSAIRPTS